jgi:hypothetical protein
MFLRHIRTLCNTCRCFCDIQVLSSTLVVLSATCADISVTPKVSLRHVQMFLRHKKSLCNTCRCFCKPNVSTLRRLISPDDVIASCRHETFNSYTVERLQSEPTLIWTHELYPCNRAWRSWGCKTSMLHFLENQLTYAGEFSASRTGRSSTPRKIPGTHFC